VNDAKEESHLTDDDEEEYSVQELKEPKATKNKKTTKKVSTKK
jgi:hypothetical protein